MQLQQKSIEEFKNILVRDYGVSLSAEQASIYANQMVRFAVLAKNHARRKSQLDNQGKAGSSASPRENKTG